MNNPDKTIDLADHASVDEVFDAYDLKIPDGDCDCIHCRSKAINDAICHGLIPAKHVLNKFNLVLKHAINAEPLERTEIEFLSGCSFDFDTKKSFAMSLLEGDNKNVVTLIVAFANRAWMKKHTDRLPKRISVQFR